MKLQGEKPWDQESRRGGMLRVYEELSMFLRGEKREEQIFEMAKRRAMILLAEMAREIPMPIDSNRKQ